MIVRELRVQDFLSASNFSHRDDGRSLVPFFRGLEIGRSADIIIIAVNGSWRANMQDGTTGAGPERLGVTPNSRWLYQGFLDSKVTIRVLRDEAGEMKKYDLVFEDGKRVVRAL